jgi:hypothetical protein
MTNGTTRNSKIIIGSDEQSCWATPSEIFTTSDSTITFENIGKGKVTVLFPENSPIPDPDKSFSIEVNGTHPVTITTKEKLIIPYDVYNNLYRTYASAEQRPIIIVYPG